MNKSIFALTLTLLLSASASAVLLPVISTFDADTVGAPPALGGPDQPTALTIPAGGTITVWDESNGITTQPVELWDGDTYEYTSVDYIFDAMTTGTLIVEATVSFSTLMEGYFLQTTDDDFAVTTRLSMMSNGSILAGGNIVGTYSPFTPFDVRMVIDIDAELWSVVIDDEMNGFDDDTVFDNLAPVNPSLGISEIDSVHACYNRNDITAADVESPASIELATIAYDNIRIPEPATVALLAAGAGTLLRRKKK